MTDPDPLATDTVAWTLTQNGIVIATGTGTSFTFTIPSPVGLLVATATATDSDGGAGSDSAQIVVINQSGATVVINPVGITIVDRRSPISTTPSAGADRLIALVYGSNDLVDASTDDRVPSSSTATAANETLIGGSGDDLLVAGPGANSLVGGTGDDTLVSNGGDDTLVGGTGNDLVPDQPRPRPTRDRRPAGPIRSTSRSPPSRSRINLGTGVRPDADRRLQQR